MIEDYSSKRLKFVEKVQKLEQVRAEKIAIIARQGLHHLIKVLKRTITKLKCLMTLLPWPPPPLLYPLLVPATHPFPPNLAGILELDAKWQKRERLARMPFILMNT